MADIKLGEEVQDRITGFQGIAVSRTTFLNGCSRIEVQPKVNGTGKVPESKVFDEPDLEFVGNGILPEEEREPTYGNPKFKAPRTGH